MTEPLSPAPDPTPEPEQPKKKPAVAKTASYIVFEQTGEEDTWMVIDTVTAKSPDDAIEIAVEKRPEDHQAGKYVSVAEARWNPADMEPKVERSLILKRVK